MTEKRSVIEGIDINIQMIKAMDTIQMLFRSIQRIIIKFPITLLLLED